jgi:uncharacterized membrane protein YedE/YeeE
MQKLLISLLSGLLFGFGLAIAGMTNPQKVLGFLDITGNWDASLMLVLGGAVGVTALCFRLILRRSAPVFDPEFHLPQKTAVDAPLIIGSILFGIGWGISGYCPGPAVALLAAPGRETLVFLPAMLAGWLLYAGINKVRG